ncbi:hypothetical protein [Actinokineospora sp. HUAS TT18]|uniref:hypothetical protein n=1 Tax=Actinokineospora sp. HUAS TT18 TaxID=3447451 RepID=UPI003F525A51
MRRGGFDPIGDSVQQLFRVCVLVLAGVLALKWAIEAVQEMLPWIIGAFAVVALGWIVVRLIRWRRSRW